MKHMPSNLFYDILYTQNIKNVIDTQQTGYKWIKFNLTFYASIFWDAATAY